MVCPIKVKYDCTDFLIITILCYEYVLINGLFLEYSLYVVDVI